MAATPQRCVSEIVEQRQFHCLVERELRDFERELSPPHPRQVVDELNAREDAGGNEQQERSRDGALWHRVLDGARDRLGIVRSEAVEYLVERRDLGLDGVDPSIEYDAARYAGTPLPRQRRGKQRLSLGMSVDLSVAPGLGDESKLAGRGPGESLRPWVRATISAVIDPDDEDEPCVVVVAKRARQRVSATSLRPRMTVVVRDSTVRPPSWA